MPGLTGYVQRRRAFLAAREAVGAAVEKQAHDTGVTVGARAVQRTPAASAGPRTDGRAAREKEPHDLELTLEARVVQRRVAVVVAALDVCAAVEQNAGYVGMPLGTGPVQRRRHVHCIRTSVRAGGEQRAYNLRVTREACGCKRRVPVLVSRVDDSATLEKQPRGRELAMHARNVQRCGTSAALGLDVGTGGEQRAHDLQVAHGACGGQRNLPVRILRVDCSTARKQQLYDLEPASAAR